MDLYNIPGDDHEKYRKNYFLNLIKDTDKNFIDGTMDYQFLIPFANDFELNKDQRVWLAFLYSLSYSTSTAIRAFYNMPEFDCITPTMLEDFWTRDKETLYFNPDKIKLKYMDQFVPAIKSFRANVGTTPFDSIFSVVDKGGFDKLYKGLLKNYRFVGPNGAYLFFDALYGLLPEYYVDITHIDWKNLGGTVAEGMAHFLYQDELIEKSKNTQYDIVEFNRVAELLKKKSNQPLIHVESELCAFRKLFKQTRYGGYYCDRMMEEYLKVEKFLSKDVDLWAYRKEVAPKRLLGEFNGWTGIRKNKMSDWVEKGV